VIGNSKVAFQRGTLLFHDGLAWAAQIVMFVVLGLLSTPSALIEVAGPALLIATALILVARPIAVVPLLLPFRYSWREHVLVSWVGLKGAVPIILATYPLIFGIPSGPLLFNVVFFVVIVSAVLQGSTLSWAARLLGLEKPPEPAPPASLELTSLREIDADILDYPIDDESRATGRLLRELALPSGSSVAMIIREDAVIPPRGSTRILAGDHVFIVVDRESRRPLDRVFARRDASVPQEPLLAEFPLPGTATSGDLANLYDIETGEPPEVTLAELIRSRVPNAAVGSSITLGEARLRVREIQDGTITLVGLGLAEEADEA
jgi:potassium/hydrogen antiporter